MILYSDTVTKNKFKVAKESVVRGPKLLEPEPLIDQSSSLLSDVRNCSAAMDAGESAPVESNGRGEVGDEDMVENPEEFVGGSVCSQAA